MHSTRRIPSSEGVELAVHDFGGDGPVILLAHATMFHGLVWAPIAERLRDRFRCVALDFRGHGDSLAPKGHHFAWEGFADDLLAVVDALELGRPYGVGHSKGAAALLLAEQRRPNTFEALWCYEPVIFPFDSPPVEPLPDEHLPIVLGALRRRSTFGSRDDVFAAYSSKPPLDALAPEALRAYVDHGFAEQPDGTVALKLQPEDEAQVYRMGSAHAAYARLGEVRCPTVVACGETTDAINAAHSKLLADRLVDGRVEEFEALGHFGPLEAPDRVAAAIATFFSAPRP